MFVLDTNAVLYLLGGRLAEPLPQGEYSISVVTEIELLSFPRLTEEEHASIEAFISVAGLVDLTAEIRQTAISLRRRHNLKIPDAIVAGTALVLGAELLTNDTKLHRVPLLRTRALRLREL